jgi:hypothetical protein
VFVVRYAALLALAVWVGGMLALLSLDPGPARTLPLVRQLAYPCGGVILISLLVLKFVGPPPPAFSFRAALTAAMMALAAYSHLTNAASSVPTVATLFIGLVLLSWYARE